METIGQFRRYTPEELQKIGEVQESSDAKIEESVLGREIKKEKKQKKMDGKFEEMFKSSFNVPVKTEDGRTVDKKIRFFEAFMEYNNKTGNVKIKAEPAQQTIISTGTQPMIMEGPSNMSVLKPASIKQQPISRLGAMGEYPPQEEEESDIVYEKGKAKAVELSKEAEELDEIQNMKIVDDFPFNYEFSEPEEKDLNKGVILILTVNEDIFKITEDTFKTGTANSIINFFDQKQDFDSMTTNIRKALIKVLHIMKDKYNELIDFKVKAGKGYAIVSYNGKITEHKLNQDGKGLNHSRGRFRKPHNPLTIKIISDEVGQLGNKYINMIQLMYYQYLKIVDVEQRVFYNARITPGVYELLMKPNAVRTNATTKYTKKFEDDDVKTFAEIVRICNVKPSASAYNSAKWKLIEPYTRIKPTKNNLLKENDKMLGNGLNLSNSDDMIEYIGRGITAYNAGNTSRYLKENVKYRINQLHTKKAISDDEKKVLLERIGV